MFNLLHTLQAMLMNCHSICICACWFGCYWTWFSSNGINLFSTYLCKRRKLGKSTKKTNKVCHSTWQLNANYEKKNSNCKAHAESMTFKMRKKIDWINRSNSRAQWQKHKNIGKNEGERLIFFRLEFIYVLFACNESPPLRFQRSGKKTPTDEWIKDINRLHSFFLFLSLSPSAVRLYSKTLCLLFNLSFFFFFSVFSDAWLNWFVLYILRNFKPLKNGMEWEKKWIWINKEIVDCFVHFVDRFPNEIIAFVRFSSSHRIDDMMTTEICVDILAMAFVGIKADFPANHSTISMFDHCLVCRFFFFFFFFCQSSIYWIG